MKAMKRDCVEITKRETRFERYQKTRAITQNVVDRESVNTMLLQTAVL